MYYEALDVAKYVVNYCNVDRDVGLQCGQLHSILYFLWIDYYKKTKEYLFHDSILAYEDGVVVEAIRHEFPLFGNMDERIHELRKYKVGTIRKWRGLNRRIDKYMKIPPSSIRLMTKRKGSPWDVTVKLRSSTGFVIDFDLIVELECGG